MYTAKSNNNNKDPSGQDKGLEHKNEFVENGRFERGKDRVKRGRKYVTMRGRQIPE